MLIIFLILFSVVGVFAVIPIRDKVNLLLILSLVGIILILFSTFRGEYLDRDYPDYKMLFFDKGYDLAVEISFIIIRGLVKTVLANNFVFFLAIYAFIGVSTKFVGIVKLTEFWFASVLIYMGHLYITQDLTQIRAGACSGVLLLSLIPLQEKRAIPFFLLAFLASLFHFSGLIIFLFWFLDTKNIKKRFWIWVIPSCYVAFLVHLNVSNLVKLIPIDLVQGKLDVYFLLQDSADELKVNIFSVLIFVRIFLIYLLLYNIGFLARNSKYAIILLKLYILSIGILIIAADVSTLAFRLNELLSVVEIILVPFVIYLFKEKFFSRVVVVVFAVMLLYFHYRAKTLLIF